MTENIDRVLYSRFPSRSGTLRMFDFQTIPLRIFIDGAFWQGLNLRDIGASL
jgi:hypothetical protein